MSLNTSLQVILNAQRAAPLDFSNPVDVLVRSYALNLLTGVGANQADEIWHDQRATVSETLDIAGGISNAFGTVTFVRVKALIVFAAAANSQNVVIGAAASTVFLAGFGGTTPTWAVPPGGIFVATNPSAAGWASTNASLDSLKIAGSGGGSVTYDIIIIGGLS